MKKHRLLLWLSIVGALVIGIPVIVISSLAIDLTSEQFDFAFLTGHKKARKQHCYEEVVLEFNPGFNCEIAWDIRQTLIWALISGLLQMVAISGAVYILTRYAAEFTQRFLIYAGFLELLACATALSVVIKALLSSLHDPPLSESDSDEYIRLHKMIMHLVIFAIVETVFTLILAVWVAILFFRGRKRANDARLSEPTVAFLPQ